jgi:hypothetical protein
MGVRRRRGLALLGAMLAVGSCARAPPREPRPATEEVAGVDPAAAGTVARDQAADASGAERPDGRAPAEQAAEGGTGAGPHQDAPATPAAVREAVGGVASARDRLAYGTPQALEAIAGMLERVAGGSAAAAGAVEAMRARAETLARLDAIDLERADRVKDAVERGVEALRALARDRGLAWLEPWVAAAAAAAGAIEPATPLGLQLATVQDALRSLADAVLVAEQFGR